MQQTGTFRTRTWRSRLPSPMATNGQVRLSHWSSSALTQGIKGGGDRSMVASHLHSPPIRILVPSCSHAVGKVRLWWCDNILDSPPLFPAPSVTRIASIELRNRWISRAKDVGLKVRFEPSRAW